MKSPVKISSIGHVTHDVLRIVTGKTEDIDFLPGQATEISINMPGWTDEKRPFTFTCLPEDDFLEFTIKTYPERNGVTNRLRSMKEGDELILHDVFGAINYKGEGVFIAGGAGVTPFISIFRDLRKKNQVGGNKLIFGNKTRQDIILEDEFTGMLGKSFINILSEEKAEGFYHGFIDESFLRQHITDFSGRFYVCGPPPMMDKVTGYLDALGAGSDRITIEI